MKTHGLSMLNPGNVQEFAGKWEAFLPFLGMGREEA
jgi:hypothetical protein